MSAPAIEARGLVKRFTGALGLGEAKVALDGVSLSVPRGAAFGLIGLNGAGKTTFIKAMLAVLRPSAGALSVLGGDPADPEVRARIGYLPERLHHPPSWTGRELLASCARLRRVPARALDGEIERQLARVGLSPADARRRIGGYSKGMRQRLGLASALLGGPELLVLDEPTDGVDPLGRGEIRALLAEERARGATLFLNSHLLSETERVCDRVGVLHRGRVIVEGPTEVLGRREDRWLVRLEGAFDASPFGLSPLGGGRFSLEGQGAAAMNETLDRLRAAGAVIVGLEPDAKDLEQILREAVAA